MEALTVDHSARLIETLVNKLDPTSGPKWTPTESHAFTKDNVSLTAVHTKKRDNRAGTSTWARMLLQVEGVSQHKAARVLEAFASPSALCTATASDPDATRKRLQDLDVTQYGAAKRARLGPKVAERIMSCVQDGK
jgi:ERCC4-type nuclease